MGKRRKARELVLQALYAIELSGNTPEDVLNDIMKGKDDNDFYSFVSNLFFETINRAESLDKQVAKTVQNWDFKRITLIDKLILRQALCELLYFKEIPPKVTINEAIDLAKKYSTEESGRFVNGILDAVYKTLKIHNQILKQGRGLIET